MASMGKLWFASLGVAWANTGTVSAPLWVLGKAGKQCKETCDHAYPPDGDTTGVCVTGAKNQWPQSRADFEAILDNIKDDDGAAKCSSFVDIGVADKTDFEGPSISKGVCWFYSKATKFNTCQDKATNEKRVCKCYKADNTGITKRATIPSAIPYPTTYKRAEEAKIHFTIQFPFFTKDAFECLGAMAGKVVTGDAKKHPEAFFKMAHGIRQSLGTEAADIHFVAPESLADPLEAKVDVYAAPVDMSGVELFLAKSKIRAIGPYLVKNYPELKMCAYPATPLENYETKFGKSPVYPASVTPTGSWSPARKDEILNDSMLLALGVDMRSLGVASAGVLLVVGVAVFWRSQQERELFSTACE